MTKIEDIKLYSITRRFETEKGISAFVGHIPASSFAEAKQLSRQLGATLDGEMVEDICGSCGTTEIFNNSDDEWLEEFDHAGEE